MDKFFILKWHYLNTEKFQQKLWKYKENIVKSELGKYNAIHIINFALVIYVLKWPILFGIGMNSWSVFYHYITYSKISIHHKSTYKLSIFASITEILPLHDPPLITKHNVNQCLSKHTKVQKIREKGREWKDIEREMCICMFKVYFLKEIYKVLSVYW